MRAVTVMPKTREIGLIDHDSPEISAPSEIKLRMLEVGVCGTDREIASFDYGTPPDGADYLVIGHEALGEVIETGSAGLKKGDFAVPMVRRPCPHDWCAACRCDRQDFCYSGDFKERGIKGLHGFMTEYVVDDEKYLVAAPKGLRDVAVLTEPLTIAEKALEQVRDIQERLPWQCRHDPDGEPGHCHKAVVLGAGPIGLLGAMALVARGFETFVYSREPPPNPKALVVYAIGATYVSAETDSVESLARKAGNIDLVYEAAGASKVSFELMKVLGTNGVFIFTGIPGRKAPIEFDADAIMRRLVLNNQIVFGTVNAGRDAYEAAIRDLQIFMGRWPDALRSLITSRRPMEAHRDFLQGDRAGIKNVIEIG